MGTKKIEWNLELSGNLTDGVNTLSISDIQEKLPTVTNDRYLHTNSNTGALEWSEAGTQVVELLSSSGQLSDSDFAKVSGDDCVIFYNLKYYFKATVAYDLIYYYTSELNIDNSDIGQEYIIIRISNKYYTTMYRHIINPVFANPYLTGNETQLLGLQFGAAKLKIFPTKIKDRYLHTNSSTGELEWIKPDLNTDIFINSTNSSGTLTTEQLAKLNDDRCIFVYYSSLKEEPYIKGLALGSNAFYFYRMSPLLDNQVDIIAISTTTGEWSKYSSKKQRNMTSIEYSHLKLLRDNGQLIPGMLYRITDYNCVTTQTDTMSGNHQFDIIVLATSTNTLSEDARAIQHEGDTYFAKSNLSAWKLKYCLDNDLSRFMWASAPGFTGRWSSGNPQDYTYYRFSSKDDLTKTYPYAWINGSGTSFVYTSMQTPAVGDVAYLNPTGGNTLNIMTLNSETGKGIIYWMVDEFNNECPYDFKNIRFKELDNTSSSASYYYTFCGQNLDASIPENNTYFSCINNTIKKYITNGRQALNHIYFDEESYFGAIKYNYIGYDAHSCRFGAGMWRITVTDGKSGIRTGKSIEDCIFNGYNIHIGNNYYKCEFNSDNITVGTKVDKGAGKYEYNTIDWLNTIVFDSGTGGTCLYSTDTDASSSNVLENIHIHSGVVNKNVEIPDRNLSYTTDVYATGSTTMYV